MLRFFLLRFLPRRLFPLLLVIEAWRFVRGWRKRDKAPVSPPPGRRARTVDGRDPDAAGQGWTDRTG